MTKFWKTLSPKRRRGLVAGALFIGLVQAAMVPRLWASLGDGGADADLSGQRSVMMLEHRHSSLREYTPAPVAGSLEVELRDASNELVVAYRDQWREELAHATTEIGEDGAVSLTLEQEDEAARPWWRCRTIETSPCVAYSVELRTLRVEATLQDDVLVVRSLVASSAHLIRERAGEAVHDSPARWTRYELPETVEVELQAHG